MSAPATVDRVLRWGLATLWVTLPLTTWPALGAALRGHSDAVRLAAAAGAWVVWGSVLLATLVPHPLGLTALRCAAPGLLVAVGVAWGTGNPSVASGGLALAAALPVDAVAFLPGTALVFVNGPAYPNERRYPLAPPAALLAGPLEVAWLAVAGLPVAALFFFAARQWVVGGVATVLTIGAARYLGRALHRLSLRWAVFVPAGFVLHDPLTLRDPVLFRRQAVRSIGPALEGSTALDLTQRGVGLALELALGEPVELGVLVRGRENKHTARALLFTPTRPGAVLIEAAGRRLPVRTAAETS